MGESESESWMSWPTPAEKHGHRRTLTKCNYIALFVIPSKWIETNLVWQMNCSLMYVRKLVCLLVVGGWGWGRGTPFGSHRELGQKYPGTRVHGTHSICWLSSQFHFICMKFSLSSGLPPHIDNIHEYMNVHISVCVLSVGYLYVSVGHGHYAFCLIRLYEPCLITKWIVQLFIFVY